MVFVYSMLRKRHKTLLQNITCQGHELYGAVDTFKTPHLYTYYTNQIPLTQFITVSPKPQKG